MSTLSRVPSLGARAAALAFVLAASTAAAQTTTDPDKGPPPPAAAHARPRAAAAVAPPPTLVVFITVDQMRPDYFARFHAQLTGGLKRLYDGGAVFTEAYHDHAITETAPGHSVVMSGRFPRSTGIVANTAGALDPQSPLIGGGGDPASPFRFRGSALIDWMRVKDPRARALSVSRKDRGAIFPLGRAKQNVFWYAPLAGRFTTSTYYADTLPTWIARFNATHDPGDSAGKAWTPLLAASAYPEPDSVPQENPQQPGQSAFPHRLPDTRLGADSMFREVPWMDQLTLDAAWAGVRAMDLGGGPQTDLLAISLSTTDAVGHRYGPDSREMHDQILRLDRSLGTFFDSLYALRDSTRIVVALTADHGMTSIPGVHGVASDAGAAFADPNALSRPTRDRLRAAGVDPAKAFSFADGLLFVDRPLLAKAGIDADSLVRAFAVELKRSPLVARVEYPRDLAHADTVHDAIDRRWVHMLPPDLDVALLVSARRHDPWGSGLYANHGSPYDDDAHVPMIFYGAPFRAGKYAGRALVADMAPTLAAVLATPVLERLDGHVQRRAIR